jgi:aldehyde:ferredoxin oxidoreductase
VGRGFLGKILHVDLTEGTCTSEKPDEQFYRMYLGGPGIALWYLLHQRADMADPLGPENVLVFAPGLLTGTQAPCMPRFTVCARSPLTGGFGKSEAGGYWGPQLKRAGFDAVVVRGKAQEPVYLWIEDGRAEIRSALRLWGQETGATQDMIRAELSEPHAQVAQIGPGGENLVRFACITNDLSHFNGRNGLGAVMGSKHLKAIVSSGERRVAVANDGAIKEIFKWAAEQLKQNPLTQALHDFGTPLGIDTNNALGVLPTCNWQKGVFEGADQINAAKLGMHLVRKGGCYACPIRCKRVVQIDEPDMRVDPKFGGPEYETLVMLGSNCGIADLKLIIKANELCNRLGIDTISTGMTISFAMHCYENGLITGSDTGGLDLRFGNGQILLPLIEQIAYRRGFGSILADGSKAAAKRIGKGSEAFLMEVKGQEVPAHDPRVKTGLGLQYALAFNGADHWFSQHDPFFNKEESYSFKEIKPLGITKPVNDRDVGPDKARFVLYGAYLTFLYDLLGACVFGYIGRGAIPIAKVCDLVQGATGWNTSLWELLKAGERAHTMARIFNVRCGFDSTDDRLPMKYFSPLRGGPLDGQAAIDAELFDKLVRDYYGMAGWDESGRPARGKLLELGLEWLLTD